MKIVDGLDEQAILEAELDGSKPVVPVSCARLDYLLATPFRYAPYPHGSRFRRTGQREGCFYCSEQAETAVAEAAFYHLKFFLASPGVQLVQNPQERTAFRVSVSTSLAIDLTAQPLSSDRATWLHPTDYGPCQDFADLARKAQAEVIRIRPCGIEKDKVSRFGTLMFAVFSGVMTGLFTVLANSFSSGLGNGWNYILFVVSLGSLVITLLGEGWLAYKSVSGVVGWRGEMFSDPDVFIGVILYIGAMSGVFCFGSVLAAKVAAHYGADTDRVWSWSASPSTLPEER